MPTGQLIPQDNPTPPIWGADAETSLLDIIVFSKDRACQLDALLRSMREFFGMPHRIHVVYTTTSDDFELGYDMLRRWHTGINWIVEDDPFRQTMQRLMAEIDQNVGKYLMFLVDDMMFTRSFTAGELMTSLDDDEDVLAVSLRMGENITYCDTRNMKTSPPDFSNGYRWQWKTASAGYWNYPMSQDGHIFRTSDFASLLPRLKFQNPNTLEARQSGQPFARPDMLCEARPCVINIAANRVQSVFKNRCGNISPEFLNDSFLHGQAIDVTPFTGRDYNSCHIDEELPMIEDQRSRASPAIKKIKRGNRGYFSIDLRKIPTFVLNCKDDNKKRLLMQEQLTELGLNFEFIRTLRVTPGWVGVALGHMKALRLSRARPPFMILEDDCVFNNNFQPVIELPIEAEALYLGASIFGIEQPGKFSWGKQNHVIWEHFDEGYLRVHNMLARHAVLYLNEEFQKAVIESQVEALTNRQLPHMGDIGLAMLQDKHITLLTEPNVSRQINRNATDQDLAIASPQNELKQAKIKKEVNMTSRGKDDLYLAWVSHKYRFVYFPISKNASSSLKSEFSKPRYECEKLGSNGLNKLDLTDYLMFTFLRDPVSRLLSAYHEISFRVDVEDSNVGKKPFMALNDNLERFQVFLSEIEKDKWDRHVYNQLDLIGHYKMDFYGRVETLETDLKVVFDKLGISDCPVLPIRRSRLGRKKDYNYDRFNINPNQLKAAQIDFILSQYADDVKLIGECCPNPSLLTTESIARSASQACALKSDAAYTVQLTLRGDKIRKFEIPAKHKQPPLLQRLEKNVLNGGFKSDIGLIQVPLNNGSSALAFSSSDVKSIKFLPTTKPDLKKKQVGNGHHPAMNMAEGHLGGYISSKHSAAIANGWINGDPSTYTPVLWRWLIDSLGVTSVLDVGCGEGHAASYFQQLGCRIQGIDGSEQALRDSVILDKHHRHNYQNGPYIAKGSWDLVWACEFVEHVDEKFTHHFLTTFACAKKFVVMSFASRGQPGWHHVNCQPKQYWVDKVEKLGFRLDNELTRKAKELAKSGHFHRKGLVFVRTNEK